MSEEQNDHGLDHQLPSDPSRRKAMKAGIDNLRAAFVRIDSENDFIKETLKELSKEFEIPTADLRKLAKDLSNDAFNKRTAREEAYHELYHAYTSIIDKV